MGIMSKDEIIVLGGTVEKAAMPEICRLATADKAAMEKNVRATKAAPGFKVNEAGSDLAQFESDMER